MPINLTVVPPTRYAHICLKRADAQLDAFAGFFLSALYRNLVASQQYLINEEDQDMLV
jgi:hypothetical protein